MLVYGVDFFRKVQTAQVLKYGTKSVVSFTSSHQLNIVKIYWADPLKVSPSSALLLWQRTNARNDIVYCFFTFEEKIYVRPMRSCVLFFTCNESRSFSIEGKLTAAVRLDFEFECTIRGLKHEWKQICNDTWLSTQDNDGLNNIRIQTRIRIWHWVQQVKCPTT